VSAVDSIKAKLKNRAQKENRTFQEILTVYGLERSLYRLSISPYSTRFVLKGGILLYALFQGDYSRGTADVDLLGHHIANDLDTIRNTFLEIFELKDPDDGIVYAASSLKAERIIEFKKDAGINISIDGYLDRTKLPVSIDIGFGDVVFPANIEMEYPTLLDHKAPIIQTYSKESIIAEKFEAIVSFGKANSRMKDFYDIYALSRSFDFKGEILQEALKETFINRNATFDTIVAFKPDFASEIYRKRLWTSFLKGKKITLPLEFNLVMTNVRSFLSPITEAIKKGTKFDWVWDHIRQIWTV